MVDTQHLKCCDHYGRAGSSPVLGTRIEIYTKIIITKNLKPNAV